MSTEEFVETKEEWLSRMTQHPDCVCRHGYAEHGTRKRGKSRAFPLGGYQAMACSGGHEKHCACLAYAARS